MSHGGETIGIYHCIIHRRGVGNVFANGIFQKLFFQRTFRCAFRICQEGILYQKVIGTNTGHNNAGFKTLPIDSIDKIRITYNHDMMRTENERNCMTIETSSSSQQDGRVVYKIFTSEDKGMVRFEKSIRSLSKLAGKIGTQKIHQGRSRVYDHGIYASISSPLSTRANLAKDLSKSTSTLSKNGNSLCTVHICKVELPDNAGVVEVAIENSMTLTLRLLKKKVLFNVKTLSLSDMNSSLSHNNASSYEATEVINPLMLMGENNMGEDKHSQDPLRTSREKLKPFYAMAKMYVFRYQLAMNRDFVGTGGRILADRRKVVG